MRTIFIALIILFSATSSANAKLIKCEIKSGDTYVESIDGEFSVKQMEAAYVGHTIYRVDGTNTITVVEDSIDLKGEQEAVESLNWTFLDGQYYGFGLTDLDGDTGVVSTVLSETKSVATVTSLVDGILPTFVYLQSDCSVLD